MSDCMQMGKWPILLEETFSSSIKQFIYLYTFLEVFTSFVKNTYILKH